MTSSVSSSTASTSTGYNLSSLSGSSGMQITGLASGLDTNTIITEEMAIYQQPVTNLQHEQSGMTAQNKALTSIQSELQTLDSDAQALSNPSLFANAQTVSSTNPSLMSATATSGSGAVVGGYQVQVTAMASSAQRTYDVDPTKIGGDTVTIDGQPVPLASGATVNDLASAINGSNKVDVWAAVNSKGQLVLSDRSTGLQSGSYIQTSDSTGALAEDATQASAGQDASLTVNGKSVDSPSNTVTNAIAGVALTISGITPPSSPVTINVGAPAPSQSNITTALNAFITQYNKVVGDVQTQLSTAPSSSDPTVGTLFGDPALKGLLASMRTSMFTSVTGSSTGIRSMLDIGVNTGATTGSGAVSQSALTGDLQLNSTTLSSALSSNPLGVQQMMVSWGARFSTLVGASADPGGTIDTRIQGDNTQITQLGHQISAMQSALTDKRNFLVQQFAQLEASLSSNQSTSSWLTSQLAGLPGG